MAGKPSYATPRLGQSSRFPAQGGLPIQPNIGITGIEEVMIFLKDIPPKLKSRILRDAIKESGEHLQKSILRYAPARSGRKTITVYRLYGREGHKKERKQKTRGVLRRAIMSSQGVIIKINWDKWPIAWVGPSMRKYGRPYDAWYAIFAEFGTKFYKRFPQGHQFVNKGLKASYDTCVRIITDQVINGISKM